MAAGVAAHAARAVLPAMGLGWDDLRTAAVVAHSVLVGGPRPRLLAGMVVGILLAVGRAAHGADSAAGAGGRAAGVIARLRGARHIVEADDIILLHLILVQRGVGDISAGIGAQDGHLAVDGEHPAGPGAEGLVAGGQGDAIGISDAGDVPRRTGVGVPVLGQHAQQSVRRGAAVAAAARVGAAGQIGKRPAEAAALHVDGDGDGLDVGIVDPLRADDLHADGDGLLIEPGELCVGGIAPELLPVLGVLRIAQHAVDGNFCVVLGLGQQQGLVCHNGAVAGPEAPVLLSIVPAIDVVGLDAHGVVVRHIADELIAVAVRHDLDEGAHVAGDAVPIRVGLADTLPVDLLGAHLLHESRRRVQLRLSQGLDGQGDIPAGQHRHGRIVLALAAGAGQDLHRHRHGPGRLPGQRAVGHHPRHIGGGGIGGDYHAVIAGGQQDRRVLAVEFLLIIAVGDGIELPCGRELDVADHIGIVDGRAVPRIFELVLGKRGLQQLLIVQLTDSSAALDVDGVDLADLQILAAVVGQGQRQCHGGVLLGQRHRSRVGRVIGIRHLCDGDHAGVAGGPRRRGPQLHAGVVVVVHAARVHAGLQGIAGQAGERIGAADLGGQGDAVRHRLQGGTGLGLVQADDEIAAVALLGIRLAVGALIAQDHGGPQEGVGGGGTAIGVPLVPDGAVGVNARVAAGGRRLHGHSNILDACGVQLGTDHGQSVGIRAVNGLVVAGDGGVCGVQLLIGRSLLGGLALGPHGVQRVELVVLAAVAPVVLLPCAVDDRLVRMGNGGAVAAGGPARKVVALADIRALRQLYVLSEGGGLIGHGAGNAALIAGFDVVLDDVLIVAPLGDERHLVAGEHGVLGDSLAEGAVRVLDVPALQRLVGGVGALSEQIGQAAVYLVRRHGLVRQRALVAVAVEVDDDALDPVGVHVEAVLSIGSRELIGRTDRAAALRRVVPAVKDIAVTLGIRDGIESGRTGIGEDIVVVAAHSAGTGDVLRTRIVQVQSHSHRQGLPRGVECDGGALGAGQVLHRIALGVAALGRGGGLAPAVEAVPRAGKGVPGQRHLPVVGGGDALDGAGALRTAAECDGVGDGRPLGGVGTIAGDDRFRRQLRLAVEPAVEGVALPAGIGGDAAADGAVPGRHHRGRSAVVVKGNGIGVRPHGVQVQARLGGDALTVLIQHLAVRRGGPARKDLILAGKGIGLQRGLAAVDLLLGGILRAVVGVERHHQRLTGGEIPQVHAVVKPVAAAVLRVDYRQHLTALGVQLQRLPVLVAALAVDQLVAAQRDGTLVVVFLGGDLVLKGQMGVAGEGQLQRAGAGALALVAGHENRVAAQRRDLPLLGAAGTARLRLRDDRQTLEIAVQRGGRRQCRRPIVLDSRQCGSVHRVLTGNIFGVRNLL